MSGSGSRAVDMPSGASLTYTISAPTDGRYRLDFLYGNGQGSVRNDMVAHNPVNAVQTIALDGGAAQRVILESTLFETMTGAKTLYYDLTAGTHTITVTTSEEVPIDAGKLYHDFLRVSYAAAYGEDVTYNRVFEAENATLSDGVTVAESEGASGGQYVVGMPGSYDPENRRYLEFTYDAPSAGQYQMQVFHSNEDLAGSHTYNIKAIDKYAVVEVNGQSDSPAFELVKPNEDATLYYFVDCGDHDPATVSAGDSLGTLNSVTDQLYGADAVTGYSWGVVLETGGEEELGYTGGSGDYSEGDTVMIHAGSRDGYRFAGRYSDDVTLTDEADASFTMPARDVLVEALWSKVTTPGGGDPVTPEQPEKEPETPVQTAFEDVEATDWYYEAVSYVAETGLMTGVGGGKFDPDGAVTRAMVWTVLARMDGVETEGGAVWYSRAQAWAIETGVSDGTDPMGSITREQLATMLYRFTGSPTVGGSLSAYPDAASVSAWAADALTWATQTGLVNGINGRLSPQTGATRAQLATMLMRMREI